MSTSLPGYVPGMPGLRSALTAEMRRVLSSTSPLYWPGGRFLDGTKTRDVGNSPYTDAIRAGLPLGKITSSGYYANSFYGTITNAEVAGTTQIEVSVAAAVEIVRRQGSTGTLTLTGPPTTTGTVRPLVVTYSAVNTSTGAITITAPGVSQVEQINFNIAATGGNLQLSVQKPDGTFVTTGNAAWSATDATFLANINSALDTATGVVGGIVASAIPAVDTDLGIRLTYSGTGFAGLPFEPAEVAITPTSVTEVYYTPVTSPVDGRFIAGSFVGPVDGSETPIIILPDGPAMNVTDNANPNGLAVLQLPLIPAAAIVITEYVIDYPTNAAMKLWLKNSLSTNQGCKLMFDDAV